MIEAVEFRNIARTNIRRFILFRMLFNARFYYPVFAVIFLDFGLSLEQFALLNAIWAATIILAEVPSGAISDLLGRKRLLVVTATLMVVEMAVWAFAPTGNPSLLFWMLVANRILSGLGEAAASGSDEALVFDSLEAAGMQDEWPKVLERVSRWQSFAFVVTMITGALVYDPKVLGLLVEGWWPEWTVDKDATLRLPLLLTLLTAVICWFNNLGFRELPRTHESVAVVSIRATLVQTLSTGAWILRTPFALVIILAGAYADSILRLFVTLGSEYYRLIDYPEFSLGFIGATIAGINIALAPWIRRLVVGCSPARLFSILVGGGMVGLLGAAAFVPWVGLFFAILLFASFSVVSFSLSYYLNQVSDRARRATVLSFKGLALNLGYGSMGIGYSLLVRHLSSDSVTAVDGDLVFRESLGWFPPVFLVGSLLVLVFAWVRCRDLNDIAKRLKSGET
jgi:MFS family permease